MKIQVKDLEIYDFDGYRSEARCYLEQVECILAYLEDYHAKDVKLCPVLFGIEIILDSLNTFMDNEGEKYDRFKKDLKRALAKDCN